MRENQKFFKTQSVEMVMQSGFHMCERLMGDTSRWRKLPTGELLRGFRIFSITVNMPHMGSEGRLYSSKSTNGGKGLKNYKIKSFFLRKYRFFVPKWPKMGKILMRVQRKSHLEPSV